MADATGRIVGFVLLMALVFVTLRGSLPQYLGLLGV